MLRPENTHPGDNDAVLRDGDVLETADNSPFGQLADSASSEEDAGLLQAERDFDSDIDSDFDEADAPREITMTDALSQGDRPELHPSEYSDLNTPGEIDLEELDDFTVEEALPPDARLDPLEP